MSWITLVELGLKFLGLVSAAEKWVAWWEAKRQGAEQQQAKDMGEVLRAAEEKQHVEADTARRSDDALRDELRRDGPDGNH